MKNIGKFMLDLLFPRRCVWCDSVLGFSSKCQCHAQVEEARIQPKPLAQGLPQEQMQVDKAWACFLYTGLVRQAILRMKFEEQPLLANEMGQELIELFSACDLSGCFDAIVPVPVSEKTMKKRGYNQSLLLAKPLAKKTGLPLQQALIKIKETPAQRKLERAERLLNVKGAYSAQGAGLAGMRILLVDDIHTTGSTLNECAKTLINAGASSCCGICLAAAQVNQGGY